MYKINGVYEIEQPVYKIQRNGAESLPDDELLALVLQVLKTETVSIGSLNASLVHPREVFAPAVGISAASVILGHNHPSGDVTPSREDIELTRRMVQAGEIMGIEVVGHLIIGSVHINERGQRILTTRAARAVAHFTQKGRAKICG